MALKSCEIFRSSLSSWGSGQPDNFNSTHSCTRCLTCLDFQTSRTGIPAMIELGSSWEAEFTVSLAPITRTRSVSGRNRTKHFTFGFCRSLILSNVCHVLKYQCQQSLIIFSTKMWILFLTIEDMTSYTAHLLRDEAWHIWTWWDQYSQKVFRRKLWMVETLAWWKLMWPCATNLTFSKNAGKINCWVLQVLCNKWFSCYCQTEKMSISMFFISGIVGEISFRFGC